MRVLLRGTLSWTQLEEEDVAALPLRHSSRSCWGVGGGGVEGKVLRGSPGRNRDGVVTSGSLRGS